MKDNLRKYGFAMEQDMIEVDEDLPDFFAVIKTLKANEIVKE